jgi:hypothetical protein
MVSIDDLVPELALSASQRRDLIAIGDFCEKYPTTVGLTAYTGRILERKGYVKEAAPPTRVLGARFQLTDRGGLRYRAELSHRKHCKGCRLCDDILRATRAR